MTPVISRLDELLERRGKTRYWLAKETGLSYAAVVRIARGARRYDEDSLAAICRVLKCKPGDILDYMPEEGDGHA